MHEKEEPVQATHEDQTAIARRNELGGADRTVGDLQLLEDARRTEAKARRAAFIRKACKILIPLGVLADAALWVIQNLF